MIPENLYFSEVRRREEAEAYCVELIKELLQLRVMLLLESSSSKVPHSDSMPQWVRDIAEAELKKCTGVPYITVTVPVVEGSEDAASKDPV